MKYVCNVCGWVYDEEEAGVDKPMRESLDTQGESEERGRGAPFLRSIIAKRELVHKVPVLPFKLSTLCRQLERPEAQRASGLFVLGRGGGVFSYKTKK